MTTPRGEIHILVEDTQTGEIKREETVSNRIVHNWYRNLGFSYADGSINREYARALRLYAGNCEIEPDQRDYFVTGFTLCEASGAISAAKLKLEDGTNVPYVEFRFLIQVANLERQFNSLALQYDTGSPENILSGSNLSNHVTRAQVDPPIVQGTQDQVTLTYRIYFDEIPGQPYHNLAYASMFGAQASNTYTGSAGGIGSVVRLGQDGLACNSQFGYPLRYSTTSSTYQAHGGYISTASLGSLTRNQTTTYSSQAVTTNNTYSTHQSFENRDDRWLGLCFNSVENMNSSASSDYPTRFKLHPNSVDSEDPADVWPTARQDGIVYAYNWPNAGRKKPLLGYGSPFKNVFTNGPLNFKVTYNPNQLPTSTWVPTFGGTWAADDHTPLLTRTWIDNAGPVDGTATFKMNFARHFNFQWGLPNNTVYFQMGSGTNEGGNNTTTSNTDHQAITGPQKLQSEVDLDWTTFEYENSSFGNFGDAGGDGAYYTKDHLQAGGSTTYQSQMTISNTKKFPGLDWNSWWGWSSDLTYNSERAGVEFRRLTPRVRRKWTFAEIGCNQIDWVEHIKGIPGEIDEEQILIVDSTSGIYRINYDQDTVTQVTAETGFLLCTYSKDADTGIEEIVAYKRTDNGDGTFTGSMHSNLISAFAGTDADFWATVPNGAPQWWLNHNDHIIAIRKHYRYHRLMVMKYYDEDYNSQFRCNWIIGDLATGTWEPDDTNGVSNAAGNQAYQPYRIFTGENYLKKPSLTTRPLDFLRDEATTETFLAKGEPQEWCQWHPHGAACVITSWFMQYDACRRRYSFLVNTAPADATFGDYTHNSYMGGNGWATTHDLVTLPQGDGTECIVWGDLCTYNTSGQIENSTNSSYNYGQYIFAPSSSSAIATSSAYKRKWVISPYSRSYSTTGYKSVIWDAPSATASKCNITASGKLPGYKGITSNGEVKCSVPTFTWRDHSSIDSAALAAVKTAPSDSSSTSQIDSWPIDGENDNIIMNPLLWDIFGWNGSAWVKEVWYWDYDTEIWNQDPGTVFPGKPIPSDGQPVRLGDEGITEYPYADLELTWEDKRPSNSVGPSFAEHSSQVIYNGFFWDGVTTTRITNSIGNCKITPFTWTGVVDPYRKLVVPYQGTNYMGLDNTTYGGQGFIVTDSNGQRLFWNGDGRTGMGSTITSGQFGLDRHSLVFNADMVGETVTVQGYKYEATEDLLKTAQFSMRDEVMPVAAGGLKSCLSGDVGTSFLSGDINTDLQIAGWTKVTTGSAQSSPYAGLQWIDSTQAPFNAYFPNGIPSLSGRFARYMLFQPYVRGHSVTDTVTGVSTSTNYLDIDASRSTCPTNGYCVNLQHYNEGAYYMGVFYKEHVDSEGREWLVILCETTSSSSGTAAPTETGMEIWWPKVNEGYTFEYRTRYLEEHPDNNTNLAIGSSPSKVNANTTDYVGLVLTRDRNQNGHYITGLGSYGLMSYTPFNNWSDSWWTAKYNLQGRRMVWDLRNPETNFVSLQLPAVP